MEDGWLVRGVTQHGVARVQAVQVTAAAQEVARAHELGSAAAAAAAEGVVATALLAAHIKGQERLTLQLQATNPKVAFIADINANGHLRARFTPASLPRGFDGRFDGMLFAIKHNAERELYRGVTEVAQESLASALQRHLVSSSQVPGALRSVVRMGSEGVAFAGGLYVELLPGDHAEPPADPNTLLDLEHLETAVMALYDEFRLGTLPVDVLECQPIVWRCSCSRDRVANILRSLGAEELRDMHRADGGALVSCDFCRTDYRFDGPELLGLIEETP